MASSNTRRSWRRPLIFVTSALLVLALAAGALVYYKESSARAELQAAWDEAERLDPGWRLTSAVGPSPSANEEKLAKAVTPVKQLPKNWMDRKLHAELARTNPQARFAEETVKTLREELQPHAEVLNAARKLADLRPGPARPPSVLAPTRTFEPFDALRLGELLKHDACLLLHDGDFDAALRDGQAMLVAAQAQAEYPNLMACLVRINLCQESVGLLERCLGQGRTTLALLEKTQALIEAERKYPFMLQAWRGERAGVHLLYRQIEERKIDPKQYTGAGRAKGLKGVVATVEGLFSGPTSVNSEAVLIRYYNQVVEIAKGRPRDHLRAWMEVRPEWESVKGSVRWMLGTTHEVFKENLVTEAKLCCAEAALAAERFRMKENRWPKTQEELVQAKLLAEVLLDPYTGLPLQFRHTADGLVIHSVGPKENYAGDALDNVVLPSGVVRTEFRLWNPDQRGQAPPATVPQKL